MRLDLDRSGSDRAPGTSWDPVQPWAARTGDGVTVAIPQLQGAEQGAGNRDALGCIAIDGAGMRIGSQSSSHATRTASPSLYDLASPGSHHSASPRAVALSGRQICTILETDLHQPGDILMNQEHTKWRLSSRSSS